MEGLDGSAFEGSKSLCLGRAQNYPYTGLCVVGIYIVSLI